MHTDVSPNSEPSPPREWRYIRPWLYEEQLAAVFSPFRISVIEAGTKTGKTVGCIIWLWELAWGGPKKVNYWWVAPYRKQAKIAYERMKKFLPPQIYRYNDTDLLIKIKANGCVIHFKTAEIPDALYGEDVYAVVIDEASRCRSDSWIAVRSTITKTKGPVRIIGNVKGRKNWAYRLARRAESGESNYDYHKITADHAIAAGILEEDEITQAKIDIADEKAFLELYYAIATEEGSNPFGGVEKIAACTISDELKLGTSPVLWGWDLARSTDWTVGVGMDSEKRVVGFHRWQKPWTECEKDIAKIVGSHFALLDQTGLGDPVLAAVQEFGKDGRFEGFVFSSRSKQDLMENLSKDIARKDIWFPDNEIVTELEEFEYEHTRTGVKYSAPEGLHDDCVCALALAAWAHKHHNWKATDLW